jgi:hypothetical protein
MLEDHSLVVGGGGLAGLAWITGQLAGLADAGWAGLGFRSKR